MTDRFYVMTSCQAPLHLSFSCTVWFQAVHCHIAALVHIVQVIRTQSPDFEVLPHLHFYPHNWFNKRMTSTQPFLDKKMDYTTVALTYLTCYTPHLVQQRLLPTAVPPMRHDDPPFGSADVTQ